MHAAILMVFTLLCSMPLIAQDTDAKLGSKLEALTNKWFKAYNIGDGATMDDIEVDNLVLLMPDGTIWPKTKARAGKQSKLDDPQTEHTLSMVSVRQFGDAAVLTGILTTKWAKGNEKTATTMVFVQRSGQWKIASVQWTPVATTSSGH